MRFNFIPFPQELFDHHAIESFSLSNTNPLKEDSELFQKISEKYYCFRSQNGCSTSTKTKERVPARDHTRAYSKMPGAQRTLEAYS